VIVQPVIRPIPGRRMVRLVADYAVEALGHRIVVPAAFRYDGASVPPIGWRATYTPFHPVVLGPASAHDWCYISHCIPRDQADDVLYDLLLRNGADDKRAWLMWWAVTEFGASAWEWKDRDLYELRLLWRILRRRASDRLELYGFPIHIIEEVAA